MSRIYSCDTMVALGNSTKSGNVIFAKNSDRPFAEAQPLVRYEATNHSINDTVKCTYITIPQVQHTYAVVGSKPYWIWGFEHGINEHKVVIGNEAVWSVEKEEEENGLLGMDLLRLGLERGKTAYEAMHVIISLLERYGQGGNAALNMAHKYHNSFLIADPNEAWILDTVNRRWVARKVKDVAGISNCYSTEENWDEGSPDIKEHAYKNGLASPNVPFNFAKAYGEIGLKQRSSFPRFSRLNCRLHEKQGEIDVKIMQSILRDHFEGENDAPRWSPADGVSATICMHNMDTKSSSTAAGIVVELTDEPTIRACMSRPCVSVFLPYTLKNKIPESVSYAGNKYEDRSLWWKMERLAYEIEIDYPNNIKIWGKIRDMLQNEMNEIFNPSDDLVVNCVEKLIEHADLIYDQLCRCEAESSQPHRKRLVLQMKKEMGMD